MTNRLTYEVPSKTNMGCLEGSLAQFAITLENRDTHPLVSNGTTVSEKHAALIAMQRTLVQQCKAAGLESRAPTESTCSDQLMLSVHVTKPSPFSSLSFVKGNSSFRPTRKFWTVY